MKILIAIFCTLELTLCCHSANAILAGMIPYKVILAEQEYDSLPPTPPIVELKQLTRGHGNVQIGERSIWTEDQELGSVLLRIAGSKDDRTPQDSLGYMVVPVSGETPEGLVLPTGIYYPLRLRTIGETFPLHWNDGATWQQDPMHFRIAVIAVDRAGNQSVISNVITISHNGDMTEFRKLRTRQLEKTFGKWGSSADSKPLGDE